MKRIIYLALVFLLSLASVYRSEAQYHITSVSWPPYSDSASICNSPYALITTTALDGQIQIYYDNGLSVTSGISDAGSYGYADFYSDYSFPGHYTNKVVLLRDSFPVGLIAVDSVIGSHEYLYCSSSILKCVNDSLGAGVYDSVHDHFMKIPITIEVDHNGVPYDTIILTSGRYYHMTGALGDIFSYKVINIPPSLSVTFPAGGIFYDTIKTPINGYLPKFFGFQCTGTTSFDLSANMPIPVAGVNDEYGHIYISNPSCDPVNATVTFNFSPKYVFTWAGPSPASVSGNTIIWNLASVTALSSPVQLSYFLSDSAGGIVAGDTLHQYVQVTPITGDADPSNNTLMVVDTVKAGVDPNEMSVTPSGVITAGTQLKYTINFENTGNDTAFNISVYDTLSDNVDVKSLNIIVASAVMNIAVLQYGGHNIVKFDFPNINLLDSSHHGLCSGAVIFTVNTLAGLTPGTTIFNHAGIFFDYNPVVMTDTVEDIVGITTTAASVSNISKVSVYPNPSQEEVTICADNIGYTTATFTNVLGQQILSQPLTASQTKVNVSRLPAGMYYITLRGEGGVKTVKFEKVD